MKTFILARIKKSYPYSYNLPTNRKCLIVIKKKVFINTKKSDFVQQKKKNFNRKTQGGQK